MDDGSPVCVAEEHIFIAVLEWWRGARDVPPARMGTHLPRTERHPHPQHHGDAAAPWAKLQLGTAPPRHTAHGTEGRRQEGQTDKAWQSAGQWSRQATDGTAWVWVLTSQCHEAPGPIQFLLPCFQGTGHNPSPHPHPSLGLPTALGQGPVWRAGPAPTVGWHWGTPFGTQIPMVCLLQPPGH